MYFWIFRGGFGEASLSKASPNEEKSINQLSKNGSTIDASSNEKGKSIEEMINNDGFEIVDIYEEE
ncbi:MAG: hypothetical protein K6E14_07330 [Paludibacteraceae bacterium]|nr:hypothetical protein [Paludibacteraceae bacterium]